jgi:hypothetical protein
MKCIDSRPKGLMRHRVYRTEAGARWKTVEVPANVIGVLGLRKLAEELERAARKLDRLERNATALALLRQGIKPLAVGHEVGLCEAQVRRLRQKENDRARR